MRKVLVIVGPTAVGKTDLSLTLAKQLHGEIISGDSIQIYRGFDIGSGKVENMKGIIHHGIDILDPQQPTSVADFQAFAREKIEEISERGKLPIICGGTGLYIKACLYDYEFQQHGTMDLNEYEPLENEQLYARLVQLDNKAAEKIHPNNRQRVLRALWMAEHCEENKSTQEEHQNHEMIYDALILGCTMPRDLLKERINRRVEMMFEQGLEQEVAGLLNQGVSFDDPAMKGIGYREWQPYFEGSCSLEEIKENIQKNSRQFAKRQYTWFNHQMPVHWVEMNENPDFSFVQEWLEK